MNAYLAAALAWVTANTPATEIKPMGRGLSLQNYDGGPPRLELMQPRDRMAVPKRSPKLFGEPPEPFLFDFITQGFGRPPAMDGDPNLVLRFRIYSQTRQPDDLAMDVGRVLLRLWDFNNRRLGLDHASKINEGTVDVYLCDGGRPGGEQLIDNEILPKADSAGRRVRKVNTIYIYDLKSFTTPIERLREIAHEYGHATLPPVGGFSAPEGWANGLLGEKLYLRAIRDEMRLQRHPVRQAMGADLPQITAWVANGVDPLIERVRRQGPDWAALKKKDASGMNAYLALALYTVVTLGYDDLERSHRYGDRTDASAYPAAIVRAAEDLEMRDYRSPDSLWLPLGPGRVAQGTVQARANGWAKIAPVNGRIVVRYPREG